MVPWHFFSEIFANRQKNFFVEKTYSAIVTWQKLESKVNRPHSDIKQHPYWFPLEKILRGGGGGGGVLGFFFLSIVFLLKMLGAPPALLGSKQSG